MAETIISPGVFTRENDLSFLPQGIGAIGAAFIGPTMKGPAFVPTLVKAIEIKHIIVKILFIILSNYRKFTCKTITIRLYMIYV